MGRARASRKASAGRIRRRTAGRAKRWSAPSPIIWGTAMRTKSQHVAGRPPRRTCTRASFLSPRPRMWIGSGIKIRPESCCRGNPAPAQGAIGNEPRARARDRCARMPALNMRAGGDHRISRVGGAGGDAIARVREGINACTSESVDGRTRGPVYLQLGRDSYCSY